MTYMRKAIPIPNQDTQPFWDGCKEGKLLIQVCGECETRRFPPSPVCAACNSLEFTWQGASGRGTVYTFTVIRHALDPRWKDDLPYATGVVELSEGVRLVTRFVNCQPDEVRIGMPVRVVFQPASDDISLAVFEPAE